MIDWEEVDQISFGQLGWTAKDYNYFSLSDFYNAWKGRDKMMQQHWQMHRYGAFMTQQVNAGKNNPIKKPTDLFEMDRRCLSFVHGFQGFYCKSQFFEHKSRHQ